MPEIHLNVEVRSSNERLAKAVARFNNLLNAIKTHEIPEAIIGEIIEKIHKIEVSKDDSKQRIQMIKYERDSILKMMEKELKVVPKSHYKRKYMVIGMAAFGIPLGVVYGSIFDNYAFIGVGLPIGMSLGIAIGSEKDKKVFKQGNQLDFEMKS